MGTHDDAFKALMGEEGALEALLRERLPRAVVRRFAGPPERVSETYVDDALRGALADLVARVPLTGGEPALVYCVVEHKRTPDARVLLQVLRYMTLQYSRLAKSHPGRLPPVFALLVYNGDAPWKGPRRFSDLVDVEGTLRRHVLDFEPLLLDVGEVPGAKLSRHRLLRGGLLALKAAAERDAGKRGGLVREAVELLADDDSTLRVFLRYLEGVAGRPVLDEVLAAVRDVAPEKEAQVQTIADYYRSQGARKGLAKGLAKGLEKGLAQGREEGLRRAVLSVLTRRFKKVPARVKASLEAADEVALQRWLEAALDARTLEAVFRPS